MAAQLAIILLAAAASAPAKSPAGKVQFTSWEGAGSGFDYCFFDGGVVIAVCVRCEAIPHVQLGRWSLNEDVINVRIEREWAGIGQGEPLDRSMNVSEYASYRAVERPTLDQESLGFDDLTEPSSEDGCESSARLQGPPDPHVFLRTFTGRYPQTAQRKLNAGELAALKPAELRLMRNEIYARYGLRFAAADLQAHFKSEKGYSGHMSDVDAFLTQIEKDNLTLIEKAEAKTAPTKRKKP